MELKQTKFQVERGIGDKNFQKFFDEIDGILRDTLGKKRAKIHIDEVFSLRTGLTNNNQVYSVFSQLIDKNINSKTKVNYDANLSKNLIKVRNELSGNNPDFNEIKRITDLQNAKYKEYSSKYPNTKFATFGEFDIEKNRFKSPQEVFGEERFNELPSDIQKKIKQDYRANKISIDVGGAQTQKELLTDLESKNTKQILSQLEKLALAFTVAAEAGFVGYDMLASGKSFKEAVGSSLFNVLLGDKTKIDEVEERDKRMVAEGMTPEQMGKIKYFESMMSDMQKGFDLDDQLNAITKNRELIGGNPEDTFNEGAFQLDLDKQEDKLREEIQDYHRVNKVGELENYFTFQEDGTMPFAQGASTLEEGLRRNELAQLQSVNNPLEGSISEEKRSAKIRELMLQNPDVKNYMNSISSNYGFMEGGIASLNVNKK